MRKFLLTGAAALAVVLAIGLNANHAQALTLTAPSGVRDAAASTDLTQEARWVCRYNYWSGRRHCWWEPRRRYYRPYWWRYGHRPYYWRYY